MKAVADAAKSKAVDSIQQRLTTYASELNYESLSPEAIHAAKTRVIDTLGAVIGGFFGEPCRILRNLAAQRPQTDGASVVGTRMKTTPDLAAYVNGTTARYPELTDSYHWPGSAHGHASETIMPLLAVAGYGRCSGREFILGVVLGYEAFLRISDVSPDRVFDNTNCGCIGTSVAAAKLLGLSSEQIAQSISMAVVPNVILNQVRRNHKTMFKAVAAGHAGRAGVFAALLARAGMEGPHLPFEGKAGWCEHVARKRFKLDVPFGGKGTPFKILDTQIKIRPSNGSAIGCILAAEKIAPLSLKNIKKVTIEVNKYAKDTVGSPDHAWNPMTREDADHSIPFLVGAAFMDGTVTLRSFNDAHLWNPDIRVFMPKVEVLENPEFTAAFDRIPVEHRRRITVEMLNGEKIASETGGDDDDLGSPKTDAQIEEKFRGLTADALGTKRTGSLLDRLWHLEELANVDGIVERCVIG